MDIPRLRFKGINGVEFPEWESKKLSEICDVRDGTHDSPKFVANGYPLVTSKNISNGKVSLDNTQMISEADYYFINKRSKVDKNDILMSMIGTIGNFAFVNNDAKYAIKNVALIKDIGFAISLFIFYFISNPSFILKQQKEIVGGTQKFVALNKIRNFTISLPCIPEQQKIADFLSSYDEKISIQRERVEALERRKKGLLQKVFSQEIRFKAEDGGIYEKWESKTIGDVTVPTAGATPSTKNGSYWIGGDIPWMSSGEVHNGQVFKTEKFITAKGYSNSSTKLLPPNTVVVALAGQGKTRGSVAITRIKLCTNQSLAGLVLKEGSNVTCDYLYQYLKNQYSELRKVSSGDGGRGGLNLNIISEFPIILPSLKEQRKIADFFTVIDDQINIEKERLSTMETIKKGLLQGLFC